MQIQVYGLFVPGDLFSGHSFIFVPIRTGVYIMNYSFFQINIALEANGRQNVSSCLAIELDVGT